MKFEEERSKKIGERNLRSFSSIKKKTKVMKTKEELCQKRLFRNLQVVVKGESKKGSNETCVLE